MADTTIANKVTVEDAGPCLKKLTITVPAEAVDEQIETSMELMASEVALPGFRPGRAPKRLIEKRFGGEITKEAKSQLIASAYSEAIEEQKLTVISEPSGEELEDIELKAGEAITFSVEVEVAPEFELPSLDGMEVRKPVFTVDDERIDKSLERMCLNEGELEDREVSEPGDYCVGDGVMREKGAKKDAEPLLDLKGAVIQLPAKGEEKGQILGVAVDDFAKQAGTPKAGEKITIKAKAGDSHEREDIRGKDVVIEFEVTDIKRIVPAEVSSLVERYGYGEESQLREAVKQQIENRLQIEQQMAMRRQVGAKLLESIEFALPERLTSVQAQRQLQRRRFEMEHRGLDQAFIEEKIAEMRSQSQELAARELKLFFILAKVAQSLEVQITDEEVNSRIINMAIERGVRPDQLRTQLIKSNQIQTLAQQVREHKTLDTILSKAKIEELEAEKYNEWVRSQGEDSSLEEAGTEA